MSEHGQGHHCRRILLLATVAASVTSVGCDPGRPRIAYFMTTPSTGRLAPSALATKFVIGGDEYTEYTSWQAVADAYATAEFDALILDEGSIRLAESTWVREKSTFGLVVAGINVQESELGTFLAETRMDGTFDRTCPPYQPELYSVLARGIKGVPSAMTAVAADPMAAGEGDLDLDPLRWWSGATTMCTEESVSNFYSSIREGIATSQR